MRRARRWRFRWCPFTWRYSWGWPWTRSGVGSFDYDGGGGGANQYRCVFGWLWVEHILWSTRPENPFGDGSHT